MDSSNLSALKRHKPSSLRTAIGAHLFSPPDIEHTPCREAQDQKPIVILRLPEVIKCVGLCRSTIYAMGDPKSKSFDPTWPQPILLNQRSIGWLSSEISVWIQQKIAERHKKAKAEIAQTTSRGAFSVGR
ncbi:MAG: AlpA family phage regulatory protein [Pseudomonadota bacterium]